MSQPKIHPLSRRRVYCNPQAQSWTSTTSGANFEEIASFQHKLPGYLPTKLISLQEIARQIGVKAVYLKNETSRCELPSFQAIAEQNSLPLDVSLEDLAKVAQAANTRLYAATDGNHGPAVARFSRILGIASEIFVPVYLDLSAVNAIKSEGAHVEAMDTAGSTDGAVFIQDTAFKDYVMIPQVNGYGTMLLEMEQQLHGVIPDIVVAPVGVGSFAQAVTSHSKSRGRTTKVVTAEPDAAPCLWKSLQTQECVPVSTSKTIMTGMNCGTVSYISWPTLQAGVDAALTFSDWEAHEDVEYLASVGVSAGPCGASTLSALRYISQHDPGCIGLSEDSVAVIFYTEGERPYDSPILVFRIRIF
ncbi:tryptophan synthase beta subunit-like PLP-dependent enzyme [Cadophora sp. MPI-SDFR-AT-0126]|nr:tryptophan synthase beta subunit-like PLP-dependent enzyme [Leotiomycetes sp. MPI-SDFR-AT-0126]